MWIFKSKKSLRELGIFNGFIDWHSHILPGVDDGIKTMEDALTVLGIYESLGVRKVWLTPHIMEDCPNSPTSLKTHFEELNRYWKGNVELSLGAENMLDALFEQRLENRDLQPMGDDGQYLLVETSYYTPPYGMDDMLYAIKAAGFFPILAHPERYRYMEDNDYVKLKEKGIFFQMNFASLVGEYGENAQKKAYWLLSKGMINMIGSDVHRINAIESIIEKCPKKNSIIEQIRQFTFNY